MPAENRMNPEERTAIAMSATAVALILAEIFAGVVATLVCVEVLVLGVAHVG